MPPRYLPRIQLFVLIAIAAIALVLPLPYSVIAPGPTTNLLNGPIKVAPSLKSPAISNSSPQGSLLSLTVLVTTPGSHLTATDLAAAWMRGDEMVLPEEVLYPNHEKRSQAVAQGKAEMDSSTKNAISAVANFLHRNIPQGGITVKLKDTGGPSAGLAFALALIANIDRPELFNGKNIAATGTITSTGAVGAIGGIDQKLIGANRSHVNAVLIPADNCLDITREPRGLRVIPVKSLSQAVEVLSNLDGTHSAASAQPLPHC